MRKSITLIIILLGFCIHSFAQRPTRFHNETADTARLTEILIEMETFANDIPGTLVTKAARKFIGIPYQSGTLEIEPEMITVNLDALDCTTLVENAIALAMTVASRRSSWHDFIYNLERLRYRNATVDGYPSRLHYVSDWIVDNTHRGTFREVTDRITSNADYVVKTLDFMSSNRDKYPALKSNDDNLNRIKNTEIGYRSHRFPYIKPQNISKADIREGDIIAITTSIKNLDVSHMGIATIIDGIPHLIHASSKAGKVIIDTLPLQEYVRRNRSATGIRVLRLN